MRYTVRGRITQAGRRAMEQGVYDWLIRNGVNPSTIKITSMLDRTRNGGQYGNSNSIAPMSADATIVQLTEFDYGLNKTVVVKSEQDGVAPTSAQLAEGTSALDQLIAEHEAEQPETLAPEAVTAQSTWTPPGSRRRSVRLWCHT